MSITADGPLQPVDRERKVEEESASAEDVACRESAAHEDLCCFISYACVGEAVLGLGLRVHGRSARQRRLQLSPELDLVCDYISVEAFNAGVQHATARGPRGSLPALVSSTRQSLNGWLPLYINAEHWSDARRYAPAAFAALAGGELGDANTWPRDALNVCCSLLTCAVTGFTKSQSEWADPRTAGRHKASERAVQMYADVHRLFLQIADDFPAVRRLAADRLSKFIHDPTARTRERTPNLGDLLHCLLIVEGFAWKDLAPTLLPEALRRHAMRCSFQWGAAFDSATCGTDTEALIAAWDLFAPQSYLVIGFCALFCQRMGRPAATSLREVQVAYDKRWGRLRPEVMQDILGTCEHLCRQGSVLDVFPLILPDAAESSDSLGELFLWAEKYGRAPAMDSLAELILWAEGHAHCTLKAIPAGQWPRLRGPHPLLEKWRAAARRAEPRGSRPQRVWRPVERKVAHQGRAGEPAPGPGAAACAVCTD